MNIHDVKEVPQVEPKNYMKEIFKKQQELLDEYQTIEGIPNYPFDIDNADAQIWLKDFLARVTEELAESREAAKEEHVEHQIEELADALHFMVELLILSGITPESLKSQDQLNLVWIWDSLDMYRAAESWDASWDDICLEVFDWAGLTANTLKNKKWKQTQMQTDLPKFTQTMLNTLNSLIGCFRAAGCTLDEVYVYYFKKSEVNKFRQRTKY